MDLKEEYLKRIEILQSKQKQRKLKLQLENKAFKQKEKELIQKINFLKEKILNNEKNTLFNENEIIRLNDINYINFKQNIDITYFNYKCLLEENNKKYNLQETIIIEDYNKKLQELNLELSNSKSVFIQKNNENTIKLDSLRQEISNLNNLIFKKDEEIKNEIKNNKLTLKLRFKTRNNNISVLDKNCSIIKYKRKQRKEIENKINLKEKQIQKKENLNNYLNDKDLKSLNLYIKQQKLNFNNNLPPQIKKNIYKNIKDKTMEYNKILNEQKELKENEDLQIKNLRKEIKLIDFRSTGKLIYNKLSNNKTILSLRQELINFKYKLHILKVEKKTVEDMLKTNEKKNDIDLDKIKISIQNNYDLKEILIFENELLYEKTNEEIMNRKNLEKKYNKNKISEFLNYNIYKLFNKKKNSIYKKNIEEILEVTNKELKEDIKKLENNEYILEKIKIKFELDCYNNEEVDNLKSIDELIEIQDLKQKILSC